MPDIREQKLLYHLTSVTNIPSILERGLMPRAQLQEFQDVADQEIITNRQALALENYVPFHWFARNPFDGRVQRDRPNEQFVLITVRRALAQRGNWKVVPCHPLASGNIQLLDYTPGVAAIDWEVMNLRDYLDPTCKSVCMAECLSPHPVPPTWFFKVYAPSDQVAESVARVVAGLRLSLEVEVNGAMFTR
ncbi:hypothetical protein D3C75_609680 [compost metagenome]|jgi:hypothetical protein|uniref:DarT ssDNA thymidine ADP-ribosyltransferase family protein n=1 Tax=Pseudomonas sp. NPDC087626 TaxID=3364444 RepID=UPI000FB37C88